jgi:two-component system CheB/CheR fusion protein
MDEESAPSPPQAPGDGQGATTPVEATAPHERQAQPVDTEAAPHLPFPVVGIGASAGGLEALTQFISAMPPDAGLAYVIIQHLPPDRESMMADILSKRTTMPVAQVADGLPVEPNHVYVIRPGHTLGIEQGRLRLGEPVNKAMHSRPIDDFFKSLASEQRERAIAIIMSGMGSNGSAGAQAIKAVGGLCVAQDPDSAQFPSMPRHLIDAGYADYTLAPRDMPAVLLDYVQHPYTRGARELQKALAGREEQQMREILAILRTRTRHDFNGYKRPTLFRRIQRRMGVNRITTLGEYASFLRQSPTEVTGLVDDLLIHVTGFFRDPDAWETLRERVIVPLVAAREPHASIRVWVAACSSGEEAYTLAMLLTEEAERAGKPLDIKVFATDMADRTLANARQGIYPGGIESDLTPERLERFFQREDAVYRVRQELRERVVFAPQNLLQDPPFSRLDIVTCRNLLIYLVPEVQQRVLSLLHFGLREGGTLFLGTSETAGDEGLFEIVDKKARIFRRVGLTRHGNMHFASTPSTIPAATAPPGDAPAPGEPHPAPPRSANRPSMQQLTLRALLDSHTPAAVTIDREFRIQYYHGNTERFLLPPRGEPTRDLLTLARDTVRGAVRNAVQAAIQQNAPVTLVDGWIQHPSGRYARVSVTASPLDRGNHSDYFVVSFFDHGEMPQTGSAGEEDAGYGTDARDELVRVRHELQSTIEELQTRNEELKASHEELVSTNEELQSTNEELETSREEMQSLNEELSTVNSQLHARMEEQQAASNDLASLLTSTDIAVLFLDTAFRIRRYTPAVTELLDLIPSDVGRPLADMARKFTDPDLDDDARAVLERLVPIERSVTASNGRQYVRRVLPYRTVDNRIDGVVVTFMDVTRLKTIEDALRESEERFRTLFENLSDYAVILCDPRGLITMWNTGAEQLLGFTEAQALGQPSDIIFTPEDRATGAPQQELAQARTTGRAKDERWHQRKDQSRFWGSGMTTVLHHADGSLRGYVKIMRDETARKRTADVLSASKLSAEEANRIKDEFLATLSHELRTPLGAILLWVKLLDAGAIHDPAKTQEAVNAIRTSAEAQRELIEDLLDVSRITSGRLRLQPREVDLAHVVRDAVEAIEPALQAKQIDLNPDLAPDIGIVRVDPARVRQIVWNLLTNAVKFTPPAGRIDVHLRRDNRDVEIRVSDTGIGIAPDMIAHVFERFRQGDASHARAQGGMGLGLAIVKQLVEFHGGTITAQSLGLDKGSTFTVHLPLPRLAKSGKTPQPEEPTQPPAPVAQATKPLAGRTVLVVENGVETRRALSMLLAQEGLRVVEADSATAALESFNASRPDVIISDVGLPGLDGYQFMRQIRALESVSPAAPPTAPIPAIALTAYARDTDRQQALDAGYQRHLGKPVEPEQLVEAVQELLKVR